MVSAQITIALATIGVYLLSTLVIGYRSRNSGSGNVSDWMTGGRKLGVLVLTFTYASTYHSAFAFLGAAGFMYGKGIGIYISGYVWMVVGGLVLWIIGSRIWLVGKKYDYVTPSDLLGDFYNSKFLARAVSLVLVVSTFPYIAIQMMGVGIIFETATKGVVSFEVGAGVLLLVSIVYVWMGGMQSVAWTDTLQGGFMFVAVWVATIAFLFGAYGGDPTAFWSSLVSNFSSHVTLPGPTGLYSPAYITSWWVVLGVGLMMTPHIFLRFYAADSPRTLKWVSVAGTGYLMIFYIPLAILALGGVALVPNLAIPDAVIPTVLYEYTPVWLASIIVAGAIAAAMSTADSQLHAVSTLVARDWYEEFATDVDDASETLFAKGSVVVLGGIAYVVAVQDIGFIVQLANLAFEGAAQIFPLVVGAFFWRRSSRIGAIVGFTSGVAVTAILKFGVISLPAVFPGFMAGFYGLVTNTAFFLAISFVVDTVPEENRDRIQGYVEQAVTRQWTQSTSADD
ncbi:sodium:solute symporter family protein [Haladaptatus caseinilyticus]|uniref:sodium:solute symporter family protein n=1 Tax=Haladaptatus caseinilyticus TaxID=2993314 RepID=UPI00224AB687|nr:sodium:solute symporter family protein [Haladaptatus caseinilyticus]